MSRRIFRSVREAITGSATPSIQTRVRCPGARSCRAAARARRSCPRGRPCRSRWRPSSARGPGVNYRSLLEPTALREDLDDALLIVEPERRVERQSQRASACALRRREHPLPVAEALAIVRLQVDRRQVRLRRDAVLRQARHDAVAVESGIQEHDVDEPRALVIGVVGGEEARRPPRRRGGRRTAQPPPRAAPGSRPAARAGRLRGSRDVGEAVVVAEPRVREPLARVASALVREALQELPLPRPR